MHFAVVAAMVAMSKRKAMYSRGGARLQALPQKKGHNMPEQDTSLEAARRITTLVIDGCNAIAINQALERCTGDDDILQIIGIIEDLFYGKIDLGQFAGEE